MNERKVAQNYKEEGIVQFKYKKYRLAVANFSEGLKQKCPDSELNAQLHNNRAAAHCHLGNYRSAVKDCEKAIKFNPKYLKAIIRAVECTTKLKSWDEVISWCDIGLQIDAGDQKLKSTRQNAVKEKKLQERDARKKAQEEKKVQLEEVQLIQAIQNRGIKLGSKNLEGSSSIKLSDLEPCHPVAQGSCVHFGENGELLWPVMFIYPEYQETDFIQEFSENDCIADHLDVMFGPDASPAPWDSDHKYVSKNLRVFFEDKDNKLCKVDTRCSLLQVLTNPRYSVQGGTPGLIVVVEGSKFMSEFINKYK
ncbi:tetratricopeptide repeat protein 4-like [Palaemon carinicauda]|uniref:tetratricopeptide repeat protein 4-like n=1 Tax=Palaemon carinicauda TaxID=392227 RepID=UPI0035B5B530